MVLSSDVCSSDLHVGSPRRGFGALLGVWAPALGALLHSRGASWGAPTFPRRVLGRSLGFWADMVRPEAHSSETHCVGNEVYVHVALCGIPHITNNNNILALRANVSMINIH